MAFDKFLNLIFPKRLKCIYCHDDINTDDPICVCERCNKTLPYVRGNLCEKCGQVIGEGYKVCMDCKAEAKVFERAFAPLLYTGDVKTRIYNFKYGGARYLAEPFGHMMYNKLMSEKILFDCIIPVPLSENRLKSRGYNQAELIARVIADLTAKPLLTDYLVRTKDTDYLARSELEYRKTAIIGAFSMRRRRDIKDKTVLLIDDIYTTGATANECSKKILKAGASRVYVLTLARTPLEYVEQD